MSNTEIPHDWTVDEALAAVDNLLERLDAIEACHGEAMRRRLRELARCSEAWPYDTEIPQADVDIPF